MADDKTAELVGRELFADPQAQVYAILDGASAPGLQDMLEKHQPEHVCLYRGELEADLAAAAPYLVRLDAESPFTRSVLAYGWGHHWGIFAIAPDNLIAMRKHFRKFLMVDLPDGRHVYFRYYDPRVFALYLPSCDAEETRAVFGPVQQYVMEGATPDSLLRFYAGEGGPRMDETELGIGA